MSWVDTRLKHLCMDTGQYGLNVSADQYSQSGVRLIRTSDISSDGSLSAPEDGVHVDVVVEPRHRLRPGDVLLSRSGTLGRSFLVPREAKGQTFAGFLIRFRPRSNVDPRFLYYATQSLPFQEVVHSEAVASTIQNFNAERYSNIALRAPEAAEQRRIADFLDAETARIDLMQSARSYQRALLAERQDSLLISAVAGSAAVGPVADGHAVRRLELSPEGNSPSQAIAARGILAPGAPPDWGFAPLRRIMVKLNRNIKPTDSVITAYRDGVVTLRSRRREDGYTMSNLEAGYQGVEPGDLVFHALDGFAGAVGVSDSRGKSSPVYHVGAMRGDDDPEYMALALRAMGLTGYLAIQAGNVRQRSVDFRPWESLARLPMPRPPAKVQKEISAHVTSMRSWTDRVTRSLNKQTQLLAERRQALITAAVTGQFDVSTASGRNVTDGATA